MSQTAARAADVEKMKMQMMQAMNIKDTKERQRMAREYCKDMAVELTLPAYHRIATQISRSITKNRDAFDAMSATDKVVQVPPPSPTDLQPAASTSWLGRRHALHGGPLCVFTRQHVLLPRTLTWSCPCTTPSVQAAVASVRALL